MKNTWMPATIAVAATIASCSSASVAEAARDPVADDHGAEREADEDEGRAEQQAVLEPDAGPPTSRTSGSRSLSWK